MNMVNMSLHDTVNIPTLILIGTNNDGRGESVATVVSMRTSQAEMMLRHPLCDYNNITSTTLAWLLSLYQGIY